MAQFPDRIKTIIDNYLQALRQYNVPIKEAILFGSYAKGTHREWSDIDIALVSDIFEGNRIDDKDKIRRITLSVSSEIEVVPFPPDEFNSQDPFVKEILATGVRLI
ncbi:MAG: nucleotidyltransferase domain-containing protein [Anaerolineaceae bacterium]|nr:nucleotidyltransferase domain-containing protein [Anaerolineaceae bacterium]